MLLYPACGQKKRVSVCTVNSGEAQCLILANLATGYHSVSHCCDKLFHNHLNV